MSLSKESFTIGKLREIIREIIKQNLEEASTTSNIDGGEGPPKTPYAFSGKRKKDKKKEKEIATNSTGFKVVKESLNEYWWDDLSDKDKEAYIDKHGEAPKRRGSTKDIAKSKSPKKKPSKGKHFGPRKKKPNPKEQPK